MFPTVHFYRRRNSCFNASTALFPSPPAAAAQRQHVALVWRDPWKSWFKLKSVRATPLQASSLGRDVKSVQQRSSLVLVLSATSKEPTLTLKSSTQKHLTLLLALGFAHILLLFFLPKVMKSGALIEITGSLMYDGHRNLPPCIYILNHFYYFFSTVKVLPTNITHTQNQDKMAFSVFEPEDSKPREQQKGWTARSESCWWRS